MRHGSDAAAEPPKGSFWVFGYGSLMWRPGFDYTSRRQARLYGYRRALCILSYVYRGTRDQPGLVFGLDKGGSCVGRVFRAGPSTYREAYAYLMEREMIRGVYKPRWLTVVTRSGRVTALCFVVDRRHEQYAPSLPENRVVDMVGHARGRQGSNVEYLLNTCRHLEELDIHPRDLLALRSRLEVGGPDC